MPRTLRHMCVKPMRLHSAGVAGSDGVKWKISTTPPPGTRIQPILHVAPATSTPKKPRTRSSGASVTPTSGHPNTSHQKRTARLKSDTVTPTWLQERALMPSSPQVMLLNVIRHTQRLRHDRQSRVHRRGRWEERGVDHEQVLEVMRPAEGIEHRRTRVVAENEGPALMRRVAEPERQLLDPPEPAVAEQGPQRLPQLAMRAEIARAIGQSNAIALERDPVLAQRQVLGHRQPLDAVIGPVLQRAWEIG